MNSSDLAFFVEYRLETRIVGIWWFFCLCVQISSIVGTYFLMKNDRFCPNGCLTQHILLQKKLDNNNNNFW